MTDAEQIDLLRRELADLRDRVRQFEARPVIEQPFVPQAPYQVPLRPLVQPWSVITADTTSNTPPLAPHNIGMLETPGGGLIFKNQILATTGDPT